MKQLEDFVKIFAMIVLGYILIFGIMFPAHSEDLAFSIGNDPREIVNRVNIELPATSRNCKEVSQFVHNIMSRCAYSELKVIGVWTITRGHMFITYRNIWGDTMVITTMHAKSIWKTKLVRVKSIEGFCTTWDKDWTHYFEYNKDGKTFTKRIR